MVYRYTDKDGNPSKLLDRTLPLVVERGKAVGWHVLHFPVPLTIPLHRAEDSTAPQDQYPVWYGIYCPQGGGVITQYVNENMGENMGGFGHFFFY